MMVGNRWASKNVRFSFRWVILQPACRSNFDFRPWTSWSWKFLKDRFLRDSVAGPSRISSGDSALAARLFRDTLRLIFLIFLAFSDVRSYLFAPSFLLPLESFSLPCLCHSESRLLCSPCCAPFGLTGKNSRSNWPPITRDCSEFKKKAEFIFTVEIFEKKLNFFFNFYFPQLLFILGVIYY